MEFLRATIPRKRSGSTTTTSTVGLHLLAKIWLEKLVKFGFRIGQIWLDLGNKMEANLIRFGQN